MPTAHVAWLHSRLIRLELVLVIDFQRGVLLTLAQHAVANNQQLDLIAHEAAKGILGRTHDRLASDVEAGIDQNRAAGFRLESFDQRVKTWIGIGMNGLNTRRIID